MKNTIENKAKFFAQYWEQKVFHWKYTEHCVNENVMGQVNGILDKYTDCGFLELKPLSQITDEQAIKLFNLVGFVNLKEVKFNSDGFWLIWPFKGVESKFKHLWKLTSRQADFLRGNSYALDYTTPEGETITVKEQIQYNWIKLKEK